MKLYSVYTFLTIFVYKQFTYCLVLPVLIVNICLLPARESSGKL